MKTSAPGVSVLARQVAEVRSVAEKWLYATVANATRRADGALPGDLVALLGVPDGRRVSELERLRRPPTRTTGTGMTKALERVDEIFAFRLGRVKVDLVPPNRLATLARVGLGSKALILERTPEPKRTALLTSVVRHLEASAIDDELDVFALLMQVKLLNVAKRATDKDWLATCPRLAKTSLMVRAAWRPWSDSWTWSPRPAPNAYDMVFGLFSMLGYNFSPRFRDLADQRFWRAELPGVATGGHGPL